MIRGTTGLVTDMGDLFTLGTGDKSRSIAWKAVADLGGDLRVPWNPPFSPGYVQTL